MDTELEIWVTYYILFQVAFQYSMIISNDE